MRVVFRVAPTGRLPSVTGQSYRQVLRNKRLAALLGGDAISKIGDGMSFVALPLLALQLHGSVNPALAISLVTAAPFALPIAISLFFGLGRRRFNPRLVLLADSTLRSVLFAGLGLLAMAGSLRLWSLTAALFAGSLLRLLSGSSRRLIATSMIGPDGRLAVNGVMGTSDSLALFVAGPALGGLLVAFADPGLALLVNGVAYVALLVAATLAAPSMRRPTAETAATRPAPPLEPAETRSSPAEHGACRAPTTEPAEASAGPQAKPTAAIPPQAESAATASGWAVLRSQSVALRLLVVCFLFSLFYGPVEVALPLLVTKALNADSRTLGVLWTSFGLGALTGALLTNHLRRVPQHALLVGIIGGWAASVGLLAIAPTVTVAAVALAAGGLIWGPFEAVAYTLLQNTLRPDEAQPVFTLWAAGITVAAPLGLGLAGPLIAATGARGGLLVSAAITLLLVPAAARWLSPAAPLDSSPRPASPRNTPVRPGGG
jgi:MFS family permease